MEGRLREDKVLSPGKPRSLRTWGKILLLLAALQKKNKWGLGRGREAKKKKGGGADEG